MSFCHPNGRNFSLNNISPWDLVTGHATLFLPAMIHADLLPSSLSLFIPTTVFYLSPDHDHISLISHYFHKYSPLQDRNSGEN